MQVPKGGRYNLFSRFILKVYKQWWMQYFLAPVLLTVPPVLLTKYSDDERFRSLISVHLPTIAQILDEYYILTIFLSSIYTLVVLAFAKSVIQSANNNGLDTDSLLVLIKALDGIVGLKDKRFGRYVKNIDDLSKETLFCDISQPRDQIADIVRGIWYLFDAAKTKDTHNLIRVVFAQVDNKKIVKIPFYFPQDEAVKASLDDLNKSNSAFQTALRAKKICIVPDIERELKKVETKRKYVASGHDKDDIGSIICYPIEHTPTREIPFIISIHCDEANYFKSELSKIYEHTLARFELRLSLEYSLMLIKEKVCEKLEREE